VRLRWRPGKKARKALFGIAIVNAKSGEKAPPWGLALRGLLPHAPPDRARALYCRSKRRGGREGRNGSRPSSAWRSCASNSSRNAPPGHYNTEGKPSAAAVRNGPGSIAFVKLLEDWRAEGSLKELELN